MREKQNNFVLEVVDWRVDLPNHGPYNATKEHDHTTVDGEIQ